jgi:hypothetical protein
MKSKDKFLTLDDAVEWLAELTDKMMVKCPPKERARRFRNAARIIAAAKKKESSQNPQYD